MKKIIILLIVLFISLPVQAANDLSWLKPGMKGYGLSVFKGTTPEKFSVEVIGFINNVFPKQDLILIKCSGQNLEFSGVVAGMSGSPIYINGKLIGALAYGWSFPKEAIAGVTPITNILNELDRVALNNNFNKNSLEKSGLKPIKTPVALSGMTEKTLNFTKELFKDYNLEPFLGGGEISEKTEKVKLMPGSALSVKLIEGDISFSAIGTISYMEGDTIAAFGHPFFEFGKINFPFSPAKIYYIFSSLERSFKMGAGFGKDAGVIYGDRRACISGLLNHSTDMIPVSINLKNIETGFHDSFNFKVIRNKMLSPKLILIGIVNSINTSINEINSNTIKLNLKINYKNHKPIDYSDRFFNNSGGFNYELMLVFLRSVINPFEDMDISSVSVSVEQIEKRETAKLIDIVVPEKEIIPGQDAEFILKFRPYNNNLLTPYKINFKIPEEFKYANIISIAFTPGGMTSPLKPKPSNAEQLIDYLNSKPKMDEIIVNISSPKEQIDIYGKSIESLPSSYSSLLKSNMPLGSKVTNKKYQYRFTTPWIVEGTIYKTLIINNKF